MNNLVPKRTSWRLARNCLMIEIRTLLTKAKSDFFLSEDVDMLCALRPCLCLASFVSRLMLPFSISHVSVIAACWWDCEDDIFGCAMEFHRTRKLRMRWWICFTVFSVSWWWVDRFWDGEGGSECWYISFYLFIKKIKKKNRIQKLKWARQTRHLRGSFVGCVVVDECATWDQSYEIG